MYASGVCSGKITPGGKKRKNLWVEMAAGKKDGGMAINVWWWFCC